jgi:acylphosphatase
MSVQRKIVVKGIVQGVSYRKHTKRIASYLCVKGWVRNLPDGTVEACLEGEERAVDALLAWCAFGPKRARVDEVNVSSDRFHGGFDEFSIMPDGR